MRALQALILLPLAALPACATGPRPSAADEDVRFLYAAIPDRRPDYIEASVRIARPTDFLSAERYAACIVAAEAQRDGVVWIQRVRGNRRIRGEEEDLAVLYRLARLKAPEGEGVVTAALTAKLCELDGIPTAPRSLADATAPPPLTLPGPEAPPTMPNLVATAVPPSAGNDVMPDPEARAAAGL